MKVIFAGPSIWGADIDDLGLELRGPAKVGDIMEAVQQGATAIGLIDGFFGWSAAVWHKEILYALAEGVMVFGAASMGALRAAELHTFGMIPVGGIANDFISGLLDDDADVALTSAPEALSYMPLSEPLVDALATIDRMRSSGAVSSATTRALEQSARGLFFQSRTVDHIISVVILDVRRRHHVIELYQRHRVYRKRQDALELIELVRSAATGRTERIPFKPSAFWHLLAPALTTD